MTKKSIIGITITEEIANQLLDDYYEEHEWNRIDENPTEEKIKELDLEVYINNWSINKIKPVISIPPNNIITPNKAI